LDRLDRAPATAQRKERHERQANRHRHSPRDFVALTAYAIWQHATSRSSTCTDERGHAAGIHDLVIALSMVSLWMCATRARAYSAIPYSC